MRLLIDTNVLIPLIEDRKRLLPSPVRERVSDPDSMVHVSVASLWEIAIKTRVGKLTLRTVPMELPQLLRDMAIPLVSIDERHVVEEVFPDPDTRDPFDRLLLAQCTVEDMRLVTLDRALARHPLAWRAG
jgi:PIN domain nuclease of toxin-antitoxin system